ncbi:MAG: hypothetical protein HYZ57_19780 [Acidobacteria bacterium]|nr:hypothetical protein [Acidobacteriota bacterium]MBI3282068.1 hypothetical protein [Acidobacteriota bacterium]
MRCPVQTDNAEVLLDYCARKLSADAATALDRHIQSCGECRSFAAAQRLVWDALDAWEEAPVSSSFDTRLYARIREYENTPWWRQLALRRLFWKPLMPLAAACVAGLVLLVNIDSPRDQAPLPAVEAVDLDQVERTMDDLEMLRQLSVVPDTQRL